MLAGMASMPTPGFIVLRGTPLGVEIVTADPVIWVSTALMTHWAAGHSAAVSLEDGDLTVIGINGVVIYRAREYDPAGDRYLCTWLTGE